MSTSSQNFALDLPPAGAAGAVPPWKQELNERLAATRARRSRKIEEQTPLPGLEHLHKKADSRASQLAAKVAERYAKAPSYSEILAAEARTASRLAKAAQTVAEEAQAAAEAILAGLGATKDGFEEDAQTAATSVERCEDAGVQDPPAAGGEMGIHQRGWASNATLGHVSRPEIDADAAPAFELDRVSDPVEDALVSPAQLLPANLIEFPRELVAARKARPRLAEGPLRESPDEGAHDLSQLQIFEVAPEAISKTATVEMAGAEWSSIRLDAKPADGPRPDAASSALELPLQAAPIEDRLMAGIFDIALILVGFTLFILIFAACTTHPPSGKPALFGAGLLLAGLFLLYQYLFFKYANGTPGMYYAKIALCTFDDENPTREAMRRRILALLLSAAPLGLGFVWAWFDADRLGWHDRMTRMYQRSYR